MRRRPFFILSSIILLIVLGAGLLVHFFFQSPTSLPQVKQIGANVSVVGANIPVGIKAVVSSIRTPFLLAPLGPVVEITPAGKVHGTPITLRFKLSRRVSSQEVLLAVRESSGSEWTLMKPVVSPDGTYASVTTDHLSEWQPIEYNIAQAISDFKEFFLNGLSSDFFIQAKKPTCDNESQARSEGYSIMSSAIATLYWCFGMENNRRVLKVVNHESFPLEVIHPGLTVAHIESFSLELDQLARLGSGKTTILYPFEEVDFTLDLPPGGKADLATEFSGYAQSIYQFQVGVEALVSVFSRFGFGTEGIAKSATQTDFYKIVTYMGAWLKVKDCLSAFGPVLDPKPDGGKMITGCFEPKQIIEALGWKGWLLAPIMAFGSLLEFFRSELNAFTDLVLGRDKYQIIVSRLNTQAILDSYAGEWYVHTYRLTIKSDGTGSSIEALGPCTTSYYDTSSCTEYQTFRFTVNSDGSLSGILVNVWYTYSDPDNGVATDTPYTGTPASADTVAIGEVQFKLSHSGDHLLSQKWRTSNEAPNYLCDTYAGEHEWYQCGQ